MEPEIYFTLSYFTIVFYSNSDVALIIKTSKLSTNLDGNEFIYKGYKMAVFPDSVDKQTPMIGYLPGHMPWQLNEKLTELGAVIVNKKSDNTTQIDRKLITGASPLASNELGKLAAYTLLEEFS